MTRFFISLIVIAFASLTVFSQGSAAQDFTVTDMRGEEVSLEALRGKVVVINFWSTRCVICHDEIPRLNRMVSSFKGRDVIFLGVTVENPMKVEPYLKQNRFDFEIIPNGFGVLLKYAEKDSEGRINMPYPSFYVVDTSGNLALTTSGAGKTNLMTSRIEKLLSDKNNK